MSDWKWDAAVDAAMVKARLLDGREWNELLGARP